MIKRKFLAISLLWSMIFGTVVNAQEVNGPGFSNVPVSYSQSSTFTVVMPDSFELDSTKKQDFQIYLSDYDLIDGEQVKVTPTTNTITMENQIVEIPYLVSSEATSYQGLPAFPTYKYTETNAGFYYQVYDNYILTKKSDGTYYVYCILKGGDTKNPYIVRSVKNDVDVYQLYIEGKSGAYDDREGTKLDTTTPENVSSFKYNKSTNTWDYTWASLGIEKVDQDKTIIQSTLPISDGKNSGVEFKQYTKTVKDPVDITITMESNIMSDGTPINGTIEGPDLSSGEWLGEVVFEISLVK